MGYLNVAHAIILLVFLKILLKKKTQIQILTVYWLKALNILTHEQLRFIVTFSINIRLFQDFAIWLLKISRVFDTVFLNCQIMYAPAVIC